MANALAVPIGEREHARGGPEGTAVMLVEYGDYECPDSRAAYRSIQRVERRLGERLRFVFRHLPLREIHPHAQLAAEAAEEASAQGLFWEMHDTLFHRQKALERSDLEGYAKEVGLDASEFSAALADGRHQAHIQADLDGGIRSGARGTPTLFIDGYRYDGSYETEELVRAVAPSSDS